MSAYSSSGFACSKRPFCSLAPLQTGACTVSFLSFPSLKSTLGSSEHISRTTLTLLGSLLLSNILPSSCRPPFGLYLGLTTVQSFPFRVLRPRLTSCSLLLLLCSFCSSVQEFAHWNFFPQSDFLQIPPHDGHPCLRLTIPATERVVDFHSLVITHARRTRKLKAPPELAVPSVLIF